MTARCPRCDRPRGDQSRADATFAVHLWRRGRIQHNAAVAAAQDEQPGLCIEQTCYAHEVGWRARCLAAEAERDAIAQAGINRGRSWESSEWCLNLGVKDRAEAAAIKAERDALRAATECVLAEIEAAIAEGERVAEKRGGQHVTYSRSFASVCHHPSVMRDLRILAETLRRALDALDSATVRAEARSKESDHA